MTNGQNMIFLHLLKEVGLMPDQEFRFDSKRKWRFDYAFPDKCLAIEIEGGVYTKGAHGSITGIKRDIEKYSEAAAAGWRVIRVLPEDMTKERTINLIKLAYSHQ